MAYVKNNEITVVDNKDKTHIVLAIKPYSSHPADNYLFTVIHTASVLYSPLVVHTFNILTGGFSNGQYCENMEQALQEFNNR